MMNNFQFNKPQMPTNPLMNDNVKQMASMMKFMNNPTAMLTQMAQNNPQAKEMLDLMSAGKSPKDLFYQTAQKQGVDPEEMIKEMRNMFR